MSTSSGGHTIGRRPALSSQSDLTIDILYWNCKTFGLCLTWPAAFVPGVIGAAVVVGAAVVGAVVVVSQVLAQAPLQQVRPVSQRPF